MPTPKVKMLNLRTVLEADGWKVEKDPSFVARARIFNKSNLVRYRPPRKSKKYPDLKLAVVGRNVKIAETATLQGERVCIGDNVEIGHQVAIMGRTTIDARVKISYGTLLKEQAFVQQDALLGMCCVVGEGAYIGERVVMEDYSSVQQHSILNAQGKLGLYAKIGSWVHTGARIEVGNHASIGNHCYIGHDTKIAGWVEVEASAKLGAHCVLEPESSVRERATLPDHVAGCFRVAVDAVLAGGARRAWDIGSHGPYRLTLNDVDGDARITAGCRNMTIPEAERHCRKSGPDYAVYLGLLTGARKIARLNKLKI